MRLKKLWIDGFKNLNDFEIDFEKRDGITVLIGNNASGKSNILEAISAIFAGLYNNELEKLPFKFNLFYSIGFDHSEVGESYEKTQYVDINITKQKQVKYKVKEIGQNKFEIAYKKQKYVTSKTGKKVPIGLCYSLAFPYYSPSQIIVLYSGEELRLWEKYYQKSYFDYNKKSLATDSYITKQNMLYINKYYWDIALLTMFASDMDNDGGIKKIVGSTLKEIKFEINVDLADTFIRQKPNNAVNNFIWDLLPILVNENIVKDYKNLMSWHAARHVNLDLSEFKERTNYIAYEDLFALLCVAKLPKDLKNKLITNLELHFENGTTTKDLSEGQKKQILLKLALDVLADENSLLLFDEPDAHIHISNKKLIPEMLKDYGNREIILTTHSPTLAHSFDNKHLAYVENGKINTEYNNKEKLLNTLTNGLMGVSEQQLFLQSDKDILIVEGKTDEAYISAALKVLKNDNTKYKDLDFNFLWLGGADVDTLKKIFSVFKPKDNQTIIAFFDRDDAGFKCIKGVTEYKGEKENFNGKIKNGVHIYLYPKKDGFTESNFEVEDYFPIEMLRDFIFEESKIFQDLKGKFDSKKKANLVKKCQEDGFDKSNFKGFKALFDKIIKIKAGDNQ